MSSLRPPRASGSAPPRRGVSAPRAPDPALDDYEELYLRAPNKEVVEILARSALPTNHSRVVRVQLARLSWFFGGYRPVETLRALFGAGVRWHASSVEEIADARRNLLKVEDWKFADLMKLLATGDYCLEEVLTKLPKPKKVAVVLPPVVRIGGWGRGGRELRLARAELFERVWTVPVETLAKEWGLSGRGLAKACRRLRIPVPPRGHWAKVAAGQRVRRPKLPTLPSGQGEEVVIRVPEAAGDE